MTTIFEASGRVAASEGYSVKNPLAVAWVSVTLITTADAPTRARRLYRGLGFTDLLTDFRFSGSEPPYAVMGAPLPLAATATLPRSPRPSS